MRVGHEIRIHTQCNSSVTDIDTFEGEILPKYLRIYVTVKLEVWDEQM